MKETAKPIHQPRGGRRVRTIALILSVTEPNVWPGPMTAPSAEPVPEGVPVGRGGASGCMSVRLDFGIGVPQRRQVRRSWPRIQLREQGVIKRLGFPLRDLARGVVEVAENDRLSGTGRLASGEDVAVADSPVLVLCVDAGLVDPLHAIRAFLHDSTTADRHVRVVQQLKTGSRIIRKLKEIETPHLVGTVIRAVARADATVVNHVVEPLAAVDRRHDWADQLARRVLAVHAGHRLKIRVWVVYAPRVIAVDAQPMHLAAAGHLLLADHRDIVFRLASHDASAAPGAS